MLPHFRPGGEDRHLPSPPFFGGEETASRSAFQRKSNAVGEGQQRARTVSLQVRSKRLPLTCRCFLAAVAARATSSPPKMGERKVTVLTSPPSTGERRPRLAARFGARATRSVRGRRRLRSFSHTDGASICPSPQPSPREERGEGARLCGDGASVGQTGGRAHA